MDELINLLEQAFEAAHQLEGSSHKARAVKLYLQRAMAEVDTDRALALRGRLAKGDRSGGSEGTVQNHASATRFNRTPPAQAIFADPILAAGSTTGTAQPAATDEQTDDVNELYRKIVKMSPNVVVSTYHEGGIIGMIKTLGGDPEQGKKPNQKAAYLQQLIKEKLGIQDEGI